MSLAALKQLSIMLVIAAMAFAFSKRMGFDERDSRFVSRLLLFFVNPCLIVSSFNIPRSADKARALALSALASVAVHLLLTALASLSVRSRDEGKRSLDALDHVGIVFTNCGFIGIPLIRGMLGDEGVFYLMGYMVVFNIYLWIYGERQMTGRSNIKKTLSNPNVIASLAGLALFALPVRLPEFIALPLAHISDTNTALSMILLGMLFAEFSSRARPGERPPIARVAKTCALRLVASSVISLALVCAVYRLLPTVPRIRETLLVVLIASLCPVGMSVSTFACVFGKDSSYSSLLVVASSVASVATIPLFVQAAERLMPC